MLGLRQVDDPIVTAVVYRRTLRFVDATEPLFGTPYIGQTVRAGTAEEISNKRWQEEDRQARCEDKTIGLIAALDIFGADAFENEILETRRGERERMSKWADHREIELIAEHGGPLQDMDPPFPGAVRQTFNQTKGGQFTNWASIDARCKKAWTKFVAELDIYIQEKGNADVPTYYASSSGYNLGKQLNDVRQGGMLKDKPDEAERRALLESKGVHANMNDVKWNRFVAELDMYIVSEGHADVPRSHKSVSGYNLGECVHGVRCGQMIFGNTDRADRRALLESKGFKMNVVEEIHATAWQKFVTELDIYIAEKGDADVPDDHVSVQGYSLGKHLGHIRQGRLLKDKPDEAERRALLASRGVKMSIQDVAYTEFQEKMMIYIADHKTSLVPNSFKTKEGYPLGLRGVKVRCSGRYLANKPDELERVAWLESLPGWRWSGKYQPPKVQESTTEAESIVARIAAKARAKRKRVQEKRASTFDSEDDD
jgi:hypothetical protein